jgi:2-oxoglutarate ferredoxin oxidoreductase subunit alpha
MALDSKLEPCCAGCRQQSSDYSHLKVGLIKINSVWPFPEEELRKVAEATKLIIVPEMNMGKYSREVERVLKDKTVVSMPKCGGDIHTPQEILDRILEEVGVRESHV